MEMTTKNIIISIISLISIFFLLPQTSWAYRAIHPQSSIRIFCLSACRDRDENETLEQESFTGNIFFTVQSQAFNMVKSNNGDNLTQGGSVPVGTDLDYNVISAATGTWFLTGGIYDSPDMNGISYLVRGISEDVTLRPGNQFDFEISGDIPPNNSPSSIVGEGAVSCSGLRCTANRTGAASIKLTFPEATAIFTNRSNTDSAAQDYLAATFTYNFNVYANNNQPPSISCNANNISATGARINWNYTDQDGDSQSMSYIQVSADSNFSTLLYNELLYGSQNNINISRLTSGSKYYARVKVSDGNTEGIWNNCGDFTTTVPGGVNPETPTPPITSGITCGAKSSATDYDRVKLTWNYTGSFDTSNRLRARWKQEGSQFWTVVNVVPVGTVRERYISELISGYNHTIQFTNTDTSNGWVNCGDVTPPNYPEPNVEYSLKNGDIVVNKGEFISAKPNDILSANWNIENTAGVRDSTCRINTINTSGGIQTDIFNSNTWNGFNISNFSGNPIPDSTTDQRYNFELICNGKDSKIKRDIKETISMAIINPPRVSCSIQDNKKSVSEGDTKITINAEIENVSSYSYEIERDSRDINSPIIGTANTNTLSQELDYAGLPFGRYSPWIDVTNTETNIADRVSCGTITNFGDSRIRELR